MNTHKEFKEMFDEEKHKSFDNLAKPDLCPFMDTDSFDASFEADTEDLMDFAFQPLKDQPPNLCITKKNIISDEKKDEISEKYSEPNHQNESSTQEENLPNDKLESPIKIKAVKQFHPSVCPRLSLPEGWKMMSHECGVPLYFNEKTGVVTLSRPYKLDAKEKKTHKIPMASVPCFEYMYLKKKLSSNSVADEKKPEELNKANEEDISESIDGPTPPKVPKLPKPVFYNSEIEYFTKDSLGNYLSNLFEFEFLERYRYTSREVRRRQNELKRSKEGENEKNQSNVISMFISKEKSKDGKARNLSFNVHTKSCICILHEYCQNALKTKPDYKVVPHSNQFCATVFVNVNGQSQDYGVAYALNKKAAKNQAALDTMDMLAPGFKLKYEKAKASNTDSLMSNLDIGDPKVCELCINSGGYYPERLLQECINRNKGISDSKHEFVTDICKNNLIQYKLTYENHVVTGTSKNKRMARQESSQKMLALLHPKMTKWGEVIHKYGVTVTEQKTQKKKAEQEIYLLKQQDRIERNRINGKLDVAGPISTDKGFFSKISEVESSGVLEKLKKDMLEARELRLAKEKEDLKKKKENGKAPICVRCKLKLSNVNEEDVSFVQHLLDMGSNQLDIFNS